MERLVLYNTQKQLLITRSKNQTQNAMCTFYNEKIQNCVKHQFERFHVMLYPQSE